MDEIRHQVYVAQQLLERAVSLATDLARTQAQLAAVSNDVTQLAKILRDGNGSSLLARVQRLEDAASSAGKWSERFWKVGGEFALGMLLGILVWRVNACDRIVTARINGTTTSPQGAP